MRVSPDLLFVAVLVVGVMLACDSADPEDPPPPPPSPVAPFTVELNWDQAADLDLHIWWAPDRQCSQDGCGSGVGGMSQDVTNGTGPETYFAPAAFTGDRRYRVGVNLHWFNAPTTPGPRTAMVEVILHPSSDNPQVYSYGPYTFTTAIDDGGYPVTGNTESWWRPVDIVDAGGTFSVQVPDGIPLNDPP